MKNPVREDDRTTHGGLVKQGSASFGLGGHRVALVGDIVTCPEHGDNPIVEHGEGYKEAGRKWVVDRYRTQCGSIVMATGSAAIFDEVGKPGAIDWTTVAEETSIAEAKRIQYGENYRGS